MKSGFIVCPKCKQQTLPRIDRQSHATAVACQNCRAVIDRTEVFLIQDAKPPKP